MTHTQTPTPRDADTQIHQTQRPKIWSSEGGSLTECSLRQTVRASRNMSREAAPASSREPKKRRQNADPEKGTYSDPSFGGARGEMHSEISGWVAPVSVPKNDSENGAAVQNHARQTTNSTPTTNTRPQLQTTHSRLRPRTPDSDHALQTPTTHSRLQTTHSRFRLRAPDSRPRTPDSDYTLEIPTTDSRHRLTTRPRLRCTRDSDDAL